MEKLFLPDINALSYINCYNLLGSFSFSVTLLNVIILQNKNARRLNWETGFHMSFKHYLDLICYFIYLYVPYLSSWQHWKLRVLLERIGVYASMVLSELYRWHHVCIWVYMRGAHLANVAAQICNAINP